MLLVVSNESSMATCCGRDSPDSSTTNSCKKDCALGIAAEMLDSFMPLGIRHLAIQALEADVIDIECFTDKVEHLGPVREDDTRILSATTMGDKVKI